MGSVVGMAAGDRELVVKPCPTDGGRVLVAVGHWSGSGAGLPIPAPRTPAEDLVALALAVGVMG